MANLSKSSMICLTCFLVLLLNSLQAQEITELAGGSSITSSSEYVPVRSVVYRPRRRVWPAAAEIPDHPFQVVCGGRCRCCMASNSSICVDTIKCCFRIDCNRPGEPFGVCAVSPLACGCATNNCTAPPAH